MSLSSSYLFIITLQRQHHYIMIQVLTHQRHITVPPPTHSEPLDVEWGRRVAVLGVDALHSLLLHLLLRCVVHVRQA
jgi:hypothetical protein